MSDASPSPAIPRNSTSAQRAVLIALRRIGPASPDALADEVGISRSAAVAQLRALEAAGLAVRATERHGVGRPRHRYDLTEAAQPLLPSNYAALATDLLDALANVADESVVAAAFAERRRHHLDQIRARFAARGLGGASLAARARELAVIQDELGYLCECAPSDAGEDEAVRLRQHNCAIYDVARGHAEACASELELFREVLGADVVREAHIVTGDRTCTYAIRVPSQDEATQA